MTHLEEQPPAASSQQKRKVFLWVLLLFACMGYSFLLYAMAYVLQDWRQDRQVAAATRAVEYPWLYYPISEESKQALCAALSLPPKHFMCRPNREVMFRETNDALREIFPEKKTSFSQVEERLSSFPHIKEVTYDPYGNMNSLSYVFQLTEYEGACTIFQISLQDHETVERIYGSYGSSAYSLDGPGPTECWYESQPEEIHYPIATPPLNATQQPNN